MQTKVVSMERQAVRRRTYQIKSKFRLCLFITLVLILLFSLCSSLWLRGRAMEPPQLSVIHIEDGDTLWGIASLYLPKGRDIRDYIIEIKAVNQLKDANILIGQRLLIPLYDTHRQEAVVFIDESPSMFIGMNE